MPLITKMTFYVGILSARFALILYPLREIMFVFCMCVLGGEVFFHFGGNSFIKLGLHLTISNPLTLYFFTNNVSIYAFPLIFPLHVFPPNVFSFNWVFHVLDSLNVGSPF